MAGYAEMLPPSPPPPPPPLPPILMTFFRLGFWLHRFKFLCAYFLHLSHFALENKLVHEQAKSLGCGRHKKLIQKRLFQNTPTYPTVSFQSWLIQWTMNTAKLCKGFRAAHKSKLQGCWHTAVSWVCQYACHVAWHSSQARGMRNR